MSNEQATDDTSSPGEKLDAVLVDLQRAWNDLRAKLAARHSQLSDDINNAVDTVSAKVDELQAAWEERDEQ